jgi:hypothetical protein
MPVENRLMSNILGKGGFTQTTGTDQNRVGSRGQELQA